MPKRFSKEQSSRYKDEFSYIAPDPAKREQNYFLLSLLRPHSSALFCLISLLFNKRKLYESLHTVK